MPVEPFTRPRGMQNRRITAPAVLAGLAFLSACEQTTQVSPLDAITAQVTRTVSDQATTLSSPAGVSVQIPAGALPAGTEVQLSTVAAPTAHPSGATASKHTFRLAPAGLVLGEPARVDVKLDASTAEPWLASLVLSTPDGVTEDGMAQVDLAARTLEGSIGTMGTVAALIPESAAVIRAQRISTLRAAQSASVKASVGPVQAPTREIRGNCGAPAKRCTGLSLAVSDNLFAVSQTIAAVYPQLEGSLRINGTRASGQLALRTPLRMKVSANKVISLPGRITVRATPETVVSETEGRITFSGMQVAGSLGSEGRESAVATVVITHEGSQARVELDQEFLTRMGTGRLEKARVVASVPLERIR